MRIPLTRANISKKEVNAVSNVLKNGWFTMGKETQSFEEEFGKYVNAPYSVAVNSATSALFLSLKALEIGKGDEVVVPSFTFASSANVIVHCGAKPVFVDIQMDGFTMDQKSLDRAITKKTKAIIPVHYAGNRVDITTTIPIIEDSAHLIEKDRNNNNAFSSCYSFYATKNMTTGEGGMITVKNKKIYEWLKMARLHGLSKDAWNRYDLKSKWTYSVEFPGYKVNTTDINSALGRVQLKRLDSFEKKRKIIVSYYNQLLGLNNNGRHLYPVLVKDREKFFSHMKKHGVGCSFHFVPLHLQPAYLHLPKIKLPVTEFVGAHVATLPLDSVISKKEVEYVTELVRPFLLK